MDFELIEVQRTSRCGCHFGTFLGRSQDVTPKVKEYVIADFLVFNTHILSELKLKMLPQKNVL